MERDIIVPRIREGLVWEAPHAGSGYWHLRDPSMGRSIKIDERGAQIARLLDHEQPFSNLLARVAALGRAIEPEALKRVIAAFEGLGLLDTASADDAAAEHSRMMADLANHLDDVPLVVPRDLRFTCQACGSCCLGANIGPVTDDVAAALSGEKYKELLANYRGSRGLFFSMVPADEKEEILVCETRNGACVFLENDGLCGIHRRFGAEFKPRVCRLFPYQFVMTPKGIVVGLQLECRNILKASQGRLLCEQLDAMRCALKIAHDIPVIRPFVSLDGAVAMPFEEYSEVEDAACKAIEQCQGGGFELILASTRVLMERCAASSRPWPPPPQPAELRHAFYSLLQDIGDNLVRLKREHRAEGGGVKLRTDNLDMTIEAMADLPLYADVVLSSNEDDDGRRFASLCLRNTWRSKDLLLPPDLVTAMAMYGLRWLLVRALAVSRCRQVHRRLPSADDLVDAWVVVHMVMRNKRVLNVLSERRREISDIFGRHLASLVSERDGLVDLERRTEFYLF